MCVAPALAAAEFAHASGRDLLLATAIAYSVQALGWMPSSVVGAAGAAAAAAKLLQFKPEQTQDALALGIVSGGGLFQYYFDQTEEKKLHVARTARAGIEVALLARDGWKGPVRAIEGTSGLLPSYLRGSGRKPHYDMLRTAVPRFDGPLYVYPKFTSCSASLPPE